MNDTQKSHLRGYIDALRSGRYTQCFGKMRIGESRFCPLGVSLDIMEKSGAGSWKWDLKGFYYQSGRVGVSFLRAWAEFYGLAISSAGALCVMNESQGMDFNRIADILEATLAKIESQTKI